MLAPLWIIGLAVTCLVFVVYLVVFQSDLDGLEAWKKYNDDVCSRRPLSFDELYDLYYQERGIRKDVLYRIVQIHQSFWGIDPALIRPQDNYIAMGADSEQPFVDLLSAEFNATLTEEDYKTSDGSFDSLVVLFNRLAHLGDDGIDEVSAGQV